MRCVAIILLIVILVIAIQTQTADPIDGSKPTSVAGMVQLLELETELLDNLEAYAVEVEARLQIVRTAVASMRADSYETKNTSAEVYISNPLNSFALIRRLQADWVKWELYIANFSGESHMKFIQGKRQSMPIRTDLEEAVRAMHRLQSTYGLDPVDMANGMLNGKQYNARLSSLDCYTIGNELLPTNVYEAGTWLSAALLQHKETPIYNTIGFHKIDIYSLYAVVLQKQGRLSDALTALDYAIEEFPTSTDLVKRREAINENLNAAPPMTIPPTLLDLRVLNSHLTPYKRGCRGQYPAKNTRLYCRYNTTTSPFLKLAPLKIEEVHLDPFIVIFHDVISSAEIEALKELATPQLKRATIYNVITKQNTIVNTRTSKFAWLPDITTDLTIRLNKRIGDMTGFNLKGSEMLQVMNYGLGGHYDTHHDYLNDSTSVSISNYGDRISTVLFYLSDVEQGGATVFPDLEIAVFPRKGTAVVWYNLDNRVEGNRRTLHAACPVIVGSKWVCNKWIRSKNQMFIRPCFK